MSFGSKQWRDWALDEEEAVPIIKRALDLGINYFDTANIYSQGGSESILGNALKKLGVKRKDVVIATKVGNPIGDGRNDQGLSKKHLRHAIDESLLRLGTDYVDLLQLHRYDNQLDARTILENLRNVISSGKACHIGVSAMPVWRLAELVMATIQFQLPVIATMQNSFNLIRRNDETEMIPFCRSQGIGIIPFGPTARGVLAGSDASTATRRSKSGLPMTESELTIRNNVAEIAAVRGVTPAQVATAWVLGHSEVSSVIIGSTQMEHVEEACAALELRLTDDENTMLTAPYRPEWPMRTS